MAGDLKTLSVKLVYDINLPATSAITSQTTHMVGCSNIVTVTNVTNVDLTVNVVTITGGSYGIALSSVTLLGRRIDGETMTSGCSSPGKGAWNSDTLPLPVYSEVKIVSVMSIETSGATSLSVALTTNPGLKFLWVANEARGLLVVVPVFSVKTKRADERAL